MDHFLDGVIAATRNSNSPLIARHAKSQRQSRLCSQAFERRAGGRTIRAKNLYTRRRPWWVDWRWQEVCWGVWDYGAAGGVGRTAARVAGARGVRAGIYNSEVGH